MVVDYRDISKPPFKVGQTVLCIDSDGIRYINKGEHYKILSLYWDYDGEWMVRVAVSPKQVPNPYGLIEINRYAKRFIPIKEQRRLPEWF